MRVRHQEDRVRQLRRLRARALDAETSVTARYGPGGGGRPSGEVRRGESFAALSAEVDDELRRLDDIRAEAVAVISRIEDNTLAALLLAYYVNGMSWAEVSRELHYSYEHVRERLHRKALLAVSRVIKDEGL